MINDPFSKCGGKIREKKLELNNIYLKGAGAIGMNDR